MAKKIFQIYYLSKNRCIKCINKNRFIKISVTNRCINYIYKTDIQNTFVKNKIYKYIYKKQIKVLVTKKIGMRY